MKKGQSLSINTIIIAAIGLAVLVILFMITTGRLKIFGTGIDQTNTCQNACSTLNKDKGPDVIVENACAGEVAPGRYSDVAKDAMCCCI